MKETGIVYILTNPSMQGLVKIGRTATQSVRARINQLSQASGVPTPFECYFAAEVSDAPFVERQLHQIFDDVRVQKIQKRKRGAKEFFKVDAEKVKMTLQLAALREITVDDKINAEHKPKKKYKHVPSCQTQKLNILQDKSSRRPRIQLLDLDIPLGALLHFSRDQQITATVVDNHHVLFRGEKMTLSGAALQIVHELGYSWKTINGSQHWLFEKETLEARRQRLGEAR